MFINITSYVTLCKLQVKKLFCEKKCLTIPVDGSTTFECNIMSGTLNVLTTTVSNISQMNTALVLPHITCMKVLEGITRAISGWQTTIRHWMTLIHRLYEILPNLC